MRDHITLMGAEEVSRAVSNFGGHVDTLRGILSFHDEALQRRITPRCRITLSRWPSLPSKWKTSSRDLKRSLPGLRPW